MKKAVVAVLVFVGLLAILGVVALAGIGVLVAMGRERIPSRVVLEVDFQRTVVEPAQMPSATPFRGSSCRCGV